VFALLLAQGAAQAAFPAPQVFLPFRCFLADVDEARTPLKEFTFKLVIAFLSHSFRSRGAFHALAVGSAVAESRGAEPRCFQFPFAGHALLQPSAVAGSVDSGILESEPVATGLSVHSNVFIHLTIKKAGSDDLLAARAGQQTGRDFLRHPFTPRTVWHTFLSAPKFFPLAFGEVVYCDDVVANPTKPDSLPPLPCSICRAHSYTLLGV